MAGFSEEDVKRDVLGEDVLYFKDFSSGPGAGYFLICFVSRIMLCGLCLQTQSCFGTDPV